MRRSEGQSGDGEFSELPRLESWKEIAAYLRRDVRTVQRWEKNEGLPVHRHVHDKLSTVHAYAAELDAWQLSREAEFAKAAPAGKMLPARGPWWRRAAVLVVALGALCIGFWLYSAGRTQQGLWKAVPLTSYPGIEQFPSFSPDGKQLVFTWNGEQQNQFDVYVKLLSTGAPLRLTNDSAEELFPAWSPDGLSIAFLRTVKGTVRTVHIIPALGGPERKIGEVDGPHFPLTPAPFIEWTPDSKGLIVVDREHTEEPLSLFLLSIDSGEKRRLTQAPLTSLDSSPAVSPDGRVLAFVRLDQGSRHAVYLQDLKADFSARGEPRVLTSEPRGVSNLSWAADGGSIFFSNYTEENRGLWRVARSGGRATQESSIGESLSSLRAARRGDRLVYSREILEADIWRSELRSRKEPVRVVSSTRRDMTPDFSPDGQRIAYVSDRSGHAEVWVSDTSGSENRQVTSFNGPSLLGPRWSPDGMEIAFSGGGAGNAEVYVMSREGGEPRQLTTHAGRDILPMWSPDGQWIYFISSRSGDAQEVWRAPPQGGAATRVTRHGGLVRSAAVSPDGRFVYYKIGNPIGALWRVPAEGGEGVKVVDSVFFRNFAVTEDGIYFMSQVKPAKIYSIQFIRFQGGDVERIAEVEQNVGPGMSLSKDGESLLYWAWEQRGSDIMMMEYTR